MIKNKKGFVLTTIWLVYLALILLIIIGLVWFGFRISEGISAVFAFLTQYWWIPLAILIIILFHKQLRAVLNALLKKIGIKV